MGSFVEVNAHVLSFFTHISSHFFRYPLVVQLFAKDGRNIKSLLQTFLLRLLYMDANNRSLLFSQVLSSTYSTQGKGSIESVITSLFEQDVTARRRRTAEDSQSSTTALPLMDQLCKGSSHDYFTALQSVFATSEALSEPRTALIEWHNDRFRSLSQTLPASVAAVLGEFIEEDYLTRYPKFLEAFRRFITMPIVLLLPDADRWDTTLLSDFLHTIKQLSIPHCATSDAAITPDPLYETQDKESLYTSLERFHVRVVLSSECPEDIFLASLPSRTHLSYTFYPIASISYNSAMEALENVCTHLGVLGVRLSVPLRELLFRTLRQYSTRLDAIAGPLLTALRSHFHSIPLSTLVTGTEASRTIQWIRYKEARGEAVPMLVDGSDPSLVKADSDSDSGKNSGPKKRGRPKGSTLAAQRAEKMRQQLAQENVHEAETCPWMKNPTIGTKDDEKYGDPTSGQSNETGGSNPFSFATKCGNTRLSAICQPFLHWATEFLKQEMEMSIPLYESVRLGVISINPYYASGAYAKDCISAMTHEGAYLSLLNTPLWILCLRFCMQLPPDEQKYHLSLIRDHPMGKAIRAQAYLLWSEAGGHMGALHRPDQDAALTVPLDSEDYSSSYDFPRPLSSSVRTHRTMHACASLATHSPSETSGSPLTHTSTASSDSHLAKSSSSVPPSASGTSSPSKPRANRAKAARESLVSDSDSSSEDEKEVGYPARSSDEFLHGDVSGDESTGAASSGGRSRRRHRKRTIKAEEAGFSDAPSTSDLARTLPLALIPIGQTLVPSPYLFYDYPRKIAAERAAAAAVASSPDEVPLLPSTRPKIPEYEPILERSFPAETILDYRAILANGYSQKVLQAPPNASPFSPVVSASKGNPALAPLAPVPLSKCTPDLFVLAFTLVQLQWRLVGWMDAAACIQGLFGEVEDLEENMEASVEPVLRIPAAIAAHTESIPSFFAFKRSLEAPSHLVRALSATSNSEDPGIDDKSLISRSNVTQQFTKMDVKPIVTTTHRPSIYYLLELEKALDDEKVGKKLDSQVEEYVSSMKLSDIEGYLKRSIATLRSAPTYGRMVQQMQYIDGYLPFFPSSFPSAVGESVTTTAVDGSAPWALTSPPAVVFHSYLAKAETILKRIQDGTIFSFLPSALSLSVGGKKTASSSLSTTPKPGASPAMRRREALLHSAQVASTAMGLIDSDALGSRASKTTVASMNSELTIFLRKWLCNWIKSLRNQFLQPIANFPLGEAFIVDNHHEMKALFHTSTHTFIHQALLNPTRLEDLSKYPQPSELFLISDLEAQARKEDPKKRSETGEEDLPTASELAIAQKIRKELTNLDPSLPDLTLLYRIFIHFPGKLVHIGTWWSEFRYIFRRAIIQCEKIEKVQSSWTRQFQSPSELGDSSSSNTKSGANSKSKASSPAKTFRRKVRAPGGLTGGHVYMIPRSSAVTARDFLKRQMEAMGEAEEETPPIKETSVANEEPKSNKTTEPVAEPTTAITAPVESTSASADAVSSNTASAAIPPRKRGRPRKVVSDSDSDKVSLSSDASDEEAKPDPVEVQPKRKRGRPKGSTKKQAMAISNACSLEMALLGRFWRAVSQLQQHGIVKQYMKSSEFMEKGMFCYFAY